MSRTCPGAPMTIHGPATGPLLIPAICARPIGVRSVSTANSTVRHFTTPQPCTGPRSSGVSHAVAKPLTPPPGEVR
jgi:hypothetical protein